MDALREWLCANNKTLKWLAERLGITSQAVSQWTKIPADYLPEIYNITDIAPAKLRPDLRSVLKGG